MHKIKARKIVAILILIVIIMNIGIPGIIEPIRVLAVDVIDYNFQDELETDRDGIGFNWKASTKVLTINGLKNSNAAIKVPYGSKIDIQGSDENTVKSIYCDGVLTIRGNNIASLNIVGDYLYRTSYVNSTTNREYYAAIFASYLTVNGGNLNLTAASSHSNSTYVYSYAIRTSYSFIMNGGSITATVHSYMSKGDAISVGTKEGITINDGYLDVSCNGFAMCTGSDGYLYANDIAGKTIINGGNINLKSSGYYAILSHTEINGGTVTAKYTGTSCVAFYEAPTINPAFNCKILYNREETDLDTATEVDVSEIYNVYNSCLVKIYPYIPTTAFSISGEKNTLINKEKLQLSTSVEPEDASDKIVWTSSNENVATVSIKGEVTAKKPGKVTITAVSGEFSDTIDFDVICEITLSPDGMPGVEKQVLYTDTNGKLSELPRPISEGTYFLKWIDKNENEITLDKVYTTNTTIYARWLDVNLSVGEQQGTLTYGENSSVIYEVTTNLQGTFGIAIQNLPSGVTLDSNEITFAGTNNNYKGQIKLNVANTADACEINDLRAIINNNIASNEFSLKITKANAVYEEPTGKILSYTGDAQELINVGTTNDGEFQYSTDGTKFSNDIPTSTNVGTYTVYYKIVGDKNHNNSTVKSVTTVINKVDIQVEKEPTGKRLSYNGLDQALVDAGIVKGGTIQYSLNGQTFSSQIPKAKNAQEYTIYYKVVGDNNHNNTEIGTVTSTIDKVVAEFQKAPTNRDAKYTGNLQEIINAGITNNGTIEYSLDGTNFTENIPVAVEAGTYTVYYRIIGDNNHNNSDISTLIAKINKQDIDIQNINVTASLIEYTGLPQELIKAEKVDIGTIVYSTDNETYTMKVPMATQAGSYTIYYKVIGDKNHNDSEVKSATAMIIKADSNFTREIVALNLTYNGMEQELVRDGIPNGGTIYYSLNGTNFSTKVPTGIDANIYTVYYKILGDDNHNDTGISSLNVIINKAEAIIEELPTTKTLVYNDEMQDLAGAGRTSSGNLVYSIDGTTFSSQIPKGRDAGTYTIYYKVIGDNNHNNSEVKTITSIINKQVAKVEKEPTSKNVKYNGKEQALINEGSTKEGTIEYSLDDENYSTQIPTATNAGVYIVYYRIIGDKNHNNSDVNSITTRIDKQDINIQDLNITNNFLEYNGQEQPLIKINKINYGVILYSITNNIFTMKVPTASQAGVYTVYFKIVGDMNHNDLEAQSITSVISEAESTFTKLPIANDLTYNETAQDLVVPAETNDGTIEYSIDGKNFTTKVPTATDAGIYTVYYRIIGDNNHSNSDIKVIEVKIKENKLPFNDTKDGAWYYDSVKYVYENGIMTGLNETTFAPGNKLTRGQMVTLLYKMEGQPEITGSVTFPDVPAGKFYYNAVKWASDNNIVTGYINGNFGPTDNITRAQLAVILYRFAQFKGKDVSKRADLSEFPDNSQVAGWAQDAVKWAIGTGIITGNENKQTGVKTIDPKQNATRAQVATMMERYCKNVGR